MSYRASCPQCGAEVVFSLDASLLKVCGSCGSAVVRKGADIASYGKVAAPVSTPSVVRLSLRGGYQGAPPFRIVGRLQLSHGSGTWDEWLLGFDDGAWAWLSESQGKFHYMGQVPLPPVPAFGAVAVGATVDLGPAGTFVLTESREGRFVSAEGELPFDAAPGSRLRYADLQGPRGQFATIDYGAGEQAEAVYVGREVTLDEMGLAGTGRPERVLRAAAGKALSCPQCAGPLELRAPDQTQRVACPYCGSLLDATKDLEVIEVLTGTPAKPLIPLGSKGSLEGVSWTLIGFMERSVRIEGVRYPWGEYLLHEPGKGFRWLTESRGHWSFVEPVHVGDVRAGARPEHDGRSYRHFQSGAACVDHVLGEFYWAVARGEVVQTDDYVSPPFVLSKERAEKEVTWSRGRYLEPEPLWQAFSAPGAPPPREGVAPNQAWPLAEQTRSVYAYSLLFAAVVGAAFLAFAVTGGRIVYSQDVAIPRTAQPGAPETAFVSEPFRVEQPGNLEVRIHAPVNNSWLYLDGALVNESDGGVDEFDAEVSYYHGVDSDGSWSEGGTEARAYVGRVSPGSYLVRLAPQWEAGQTPPGYRVTLRSRVPRLYQACLALGAIAAWPILLAWRQLRFEALRWSESDHAWGE